MCSVALHPFLPSSSCPFSPRQALGCRITSSRLLFFGFDEMRCGGARTSRTEGLERKEWNCDWFDRKFGESASTYLLQSTALLNIPHAGCQSDIKYVYEKQNYGCGKQKLWNWTIPSNYGKRLRTNSNRISRSVIIRTRAREQQAVNVALFPRVETKKHVIKIHSYYSRYIAHSISPLEKTVVQVQRMQFPIYCHD